MRFRKIQSFKKILQQWNIASNIYIDIVTWKKVYRNRGKTKTSKMVDHINLNEICLYPTHIAINWYINKRLSFF